MYTYNYVSGGNKNCVTLATLCAVAIVGFLLELLSLGFTLNYNASFDESENGLNGRRSLQFISGAIASQLLLGGLITFIILLAYNCERCNSNVQKMIANLALCSVYACAILLTAAGIFMALSTAEQPTSESQTYGGLISAIDFLTAVLNICFTITLHIMVRHGSLSL